jgi:hypothetical protein
MFLSSSLYSNAQLTSEIETIAQKSLTTGRITKGYMPQEKINDKQHAVEMPEGLRPISERKMLERKIAPQPLVQSH